MNTNLITAAEKMSRLAWSAAYSKTPLADRFTTFRPVREFLKLADSVGYQLSDPGLNVAEQVFQFCESIIENEVNP